MAQVRFQTSETFLDHVCVTAVLDLRIQLYVPPFSAHLVFALLDMLFQCIHHDKLLDCACAAFSHHVHMSLTNL
jgi:hypothetical protein